ncbi:MAG: HD domain-containing protein [Bacteroidales bacterium]|nr:HD domain-containing protein [Bacteroidales bacterium]
MNSEQQLILDNVQLSVQQIMQGEGSGHDWWHIHRVVNNTRRICKSESCDPFITELAALVHDIGDHKLHKGDDTACRREITRLFKKLNLDLMLAEQIIEIVEQVSFKGALIDTPVQSIEAAVVQDADRLDAIGAIGIARTFAFGGNRNREIYNPEIPVELHDQFETYKNSSAPTINHFYEKLLLLKDQMKTESGKKIALQRHKFMLQYLEQFYNEWDYK